MLHSIIQPTHSIQCEVNLNVRHKILFLSDSVQMNSLSHSYCQQLELEEVTGQLRVLSLNQLLFKLTNNNQTKETNLYFFFVLCEVLLSMSRHRNETPSTQFSVTMRKNAVIIVLTLILLLLLFTIAKSFKSVNSESKTKKISPLEMKVFYYRQTILSNFTS